jgi:tetratricopeptide (TPR) repeat protein
VERTALAGVPPILPALVSLLPVAGLAAAQGGYFSTSWGWASVPLLSASAIILVTRAEVRMSVYERVYVLGLAAFACWIALSTIWSTGFSQSVLEIERALVYVGGISAALLLTRVRLARNLLGGVLAAIVLISTFSLLTRLAPDRFGVYDREAVYRLAQPIGYWNGLALFTVIGALLALGYSTRARTLLVCAASAGSLVILLPTLYFTFGRAAWIALGVGLVVTVSIDPRRLGLIASLLVVGPLPALAVLLCSREPALTHAGATIARVTHEGHHMVLLLALLFVANACLGAGFAFAAKRVEVAQWAERAFAVIAAVAVLIGAIAVFGSYGDPVTIAKRGYSSFNSAPPPMESNLNRRLLNFSGNGRAQLWHLAWRDARKHPLVGAGAGTYERFFLAHQPASVGRVRDAHSLYLETLAELGPIGLAILIATLATPLLALRRARRHPLAPVAAGAYVAYLAHTGVDWDWEQTAVTLAGLLCGASLLVFARRWADPSPLRPATRYIAAIAAVAAAVFATVTLLGNAALSRSEAARERGQSPKALDEARRAHRLLPWSPAPWQALGRAQATAGLLTQARSSFRAALAKDDGDWQIWYELAGASAGKARRIALRRAAVLFPRSGLAEPSRPASGGR